MEFLRDYRQYGSKMGESLYFCNENLVGVVYSCCFANFVYPCPCPFWESPLFTFKTADLPQQSDSPGPRRGRGSSGSDWVGAEGGKLFSPATLCVGSKQVLLVFCAAAADRFWQLHLHQTTAGSWLECTLHKNDSPFSVEVYIYSDVFVK